MSGRLPASRADCPECGSSEGYVIARRDDGVETLRCPECRARWRDPEPEPVTIRETIRTTVPGEALLLGVAVALTVSVGIASFSTAVIVNRGVNPMTASSEVWYSYLQDPFSSAVWSALSIHFTNPAFWVSMGFVTIPLVVIGLLHLMNLRDELEMKRQRGEGG